MPYCCGVPNCKGNYKTGPKVHVFSFPRDAQLSAKWLLSIKRDDYTPTKCSRVCHLHFAPEDIVWETSYFDGRTGRTLRARLKWPRLREGAVPSRFPKNCPSSSRMASSRGTWTGIPAKRPDNCSVYGCPNTRRATKSSGVRYFRFPRDERRRDEWVSACRSLDPINPLRAVVCSAHFSSQDYAYDLKSRLLNIEIPRNRRILKEDAVPALQLPEDSAPQPSTSKTKGSSRKKKKLQREEVEEEKDRKKLKLEEEDWTEETDPLALGHFQEIKIEEEDPLNDPYLLDEEANVLGASGEDLADIASVKQECTSWTDKSNQDTQSVVKAEEDFSQKKITSEQSETKKTGIMGKEVNTLWEKTSEDPARTTKSVPSKRKDNTQQEKSSQEERTAKRHRKVLKENSESDLTEFSQQFTKDVYDVFGMHVAKTLRDINNIEVFNRVKIKINDILLDALAGHFSDPGFKKKASVETQFPPVGEEISNTTPPGISSGHPPSQSFERKALTEKNFSAPKKGSLKTTVPGVSSGLDKTQTSSVDHLVNIPQHSRIPVTLHSINQPTALPVSSSLAETTHTTSVHPFRSASQHSRVPKTTHVVGRPATVPVTFIIPGKTQARTVDPHGTASKLPMIAVLPAASFGLAITQTRPVDPSRSISQSSGVPETAQRSTDATRTSTVDPSASISQHSEIPVTTQTVPHLPPRSISQSSGVPETAQRSTDATQTSTVDPSASISQHSEVPVTTQTVPRLPPRSVSQSSGVPETAQRSTDATQTSTVDPSASISQHSEIPVTNETISHLPQVPGKKKKS